LQIEELIVMRRKKKKKSDGKDKAAGDLQKQKKPSKPTYPKQMTIRYNEEQEKEINAMMKKTGDKTMSKAFLKTPRIIETQQSQIMELKSVTEEQRAKIQQLTNIVNSWQIFTKKLENFVNNKAIDKTEEDELEWALEEESIRRGY
jgi:hypothetical protein